MKKPAPKTQKTSKFVDRSGRVHHLKTGGSAASRSTALINDEEEKLSKIPKGHSTPAPRITPQPAPFKKKHVSKKRFDKSSDNRAHARPDHRSDRRPEKKGYPRSGPRPGQKTHRSDPRKNDFRKDSRFEKKSKRPEGSYAEGQRYKARVDKNRKGFAFLIFESRDLEDAFVPPREAENLFHGDRVEVTLSSRDEVIGLKVLEHRFREVVGKYSPHPMGRDRGGWVIYEQKKTRAEIFIPSISNHKVEADDWVRVKLQFHERGPHPVTGEVLDVYGKELPPSADIGMIAAEFNLIEEHSEGAEAEARTHKLEVPGKDLEGRQDLREVPFITIDGETARDFDDAVYVEPHKSGFYLWVAIADVSHYVTEGSELDKDARSRGTSVYFPERAFHMLPRALSENLCSLRPNEPRLAMVAKMQIDRNGKILNTELMEAVIQSKRRATYNEIQAEWDENLKNPDWEYKPHFDLYRILRKMRQDRGSIDFEFPEAELLVKPTGEVISIKIRDRIEAHRLIEEFMIAANEAVTEWMLARHWPFVYRVHEEPAADALLKFQELAATVGVHISLDESESPKAISDLVRSLEGHPAQAMLNIALLRSLKQAVYSSVHGIHYGLASEGYTHFTSPIRRYPDLVVHRLLRRALRTEKGKLRVLNEKERVQLEKDLTDICEHCSYRERLASDAEREAIKLKQVRAMLPHLGKEFEAKVVGMIEMGLFVQVKEPYCEGMINRDTMMDDAYVFNEDRMIFYGRRKKRTFKMSDLVHVQVLRADIDRRQIDFGLAENAPNFEMDTQSDSGQK